MLHDLHISKETPPIERNINTDGVAKVMDLVPRPIPSYFVASEPLFQSFPELIIDELLGIW